MSIDRNLVLRCALESGFVLSTFNGGSIKKLAPMADVDSLCRLIKAYEAARAAPAGEVLTMPSIDAEEAVEIMCCGRFGSVWRDSKSKPELAYARKMLEALLKHFDIRKRPSPIGINEADGERG
jgi:hypothetical protein